jgi:hypothetical protein
MTDPIVRVANHATTPVCIARDPNWDDQVLLIDGRELKQTRCLSPGADTSLGIRVGTDTAPDENLLGVIFADSKDFERGQAGGYQATIGHHATTGLLSVTDEHTFGSPSTRYAVANQTPWSMDMTFVDASLR